MIVEFNILDQALFDSICAKYPSDTMIITKGEYLRSRKDWKKRYKNVSSSIRALRYAIQTSAEVAWIATYMVEDVNEAERHHTMMSRFQSLKARDRFDASLMMGELQMLKDDARMTVELLKENAIEEIRRNS